MWRTPGRGFGQRSRRAPGIRPVPRQGSWIVLVPGGGWTGVSRTRTASFFFAKPDAERVYVPANGSGRAASAMPPPAVACWKAVVSIAPWIGWATWTATGPPNDPCGVSVAVRDAPGSVRTSVDGVLPVRVSERGFASLWSFAAVVTLKGPVPLVLRTVTP